MFNLMSIVWLLVGYFLVPRAINFLYGLKGA